MHSMDSDDHSCKMVKLTSSLWDGGKYRETGDGNCCVNRIYIGDLYISGT